MAVVSRNPTSGTGRVILALAVPLAAVFGVILAATSSSAAIVPPRPSTTVPIFLPPGGILPPPPTTTTISPRPTTVAPTVTRPTTTTLPAPTVTTTEPAPSTPPPPPAAPPPTPAAPPPPPPPPDESEEIEPEPPCQRDAVDDYYTVSIGDVLVVPYSAGLGINDILTCPGPGYTIDNLTDPANGVVVKTPNDFGAFEYTPDPGFTGADSFTYTLYQGQEVADQAIAHVNVTELCTVVAFHDSYTTPFETPLSEPAPGFLGNDTVECAPFTTNVSVQPLHGTVTVGVNGDFVYTPDAGFSLTDAFTYEILYANQFVFGTGVVTISVDEPPCSAVDDGYSTPVDTTLTVGAPGVLGNDFVCPDATSFQVDQPPISGTVTLQNDGSFEYIPGPGYVGQDSFTYDHLEFDSNVLDYVVLATATVSIDVTDPVEATTTTTEPVGTTTSAAPAGTTTSTSPGDTTTTGPPDTMTSPPEGGVSTTAPGPGSEPPPPTEAPADFRIATFNASLNRAEDGELVDDLTTPDDQQAANVAAILQHTRPDVVLLNEFDYVEDGTAVDLFRTNYLLLSQNGAQPIDYPYVFIAPSNTGIPSGFDLDNDGTVGGANDAFGFGDFPGQYGMVLLSRFPIVEDQVRTFQNLLWASVPGARLPDDPATPEPADWYSSDELAVLRLSSKSHWDVPIDVDGRVVHVLSSHPTPPVFDGPEDRNGLRNADEIGFWADYIVGTDVGWIVDDTGVSGGLAADAEFVIVGDLNSDPVDGDSLPGAVDQILALERVQDTAPTSAGAVEAALRQNRMNETHTGDPALDTADFTDDAPGNLRVDYVLPSDRFAVVDAGVFWPDVDDELARLMVADPLASSDHRLVWVNLN